MAHDAEKLVNKGRGALSNRAGRFEPTQSEACDDGWADHRAGDEADDWAPPPLATQTFPDKSRRIIAYNDSADIPFDRSINPYRGCEHGCIYCYARPSHAWLGCSAGLDFESKIFIKPEAPALLEAELRKPQYRPQPIALGSNTDPYQPLERNLKITRGIIEVLAAFNHPLTIVTKSALILRDLDVLIPMARKNLLSVALSVTTLDRRLARRMEPRAATPARRLDALETLVREGIEATVMAAPMIPALNDHELENILAEAAARGVKSAGYTLLRLPHELKDLFGEWLETHAPQRAAHVLSLLKQSRGGELNDARFFSRLKGEGHFARLLKERFRLSCARLGMNRGMGRGLATNLFRPPLRRGAQMALFEEAS